MRTANEVSFVNALDGTYLTASAAINALFVINGSKVVINNDSTGGAGLLTLTTGYTTVLTVKSYLRTLVMIVTGYGYARCVADKVDYVVRTFLGTKTAADTFSRINGCDTLVVYTDSVTGAYLNTVAVAKAGERTEVVTRVAHISCLTGLRAVIIIFLFFGKAEAVAGNVCYLLNNVIRLKSHDVGNFFCRSVATGNAEVSLGGFALAKRLCVAVAARVTASATVSAGKTVTDCRYLFVLFHAEEN